MRYVIMCLVCISMFLREQVDLLYQYLYFLYIRLERLKCLHVMFASRMLAPRFVICKIWCGFCFTNVRVVLPLDNAMFGTSLFDLQMNLYFQPWPKT